MSDILTISLTALKEQADLIRADSPDMPLEESYGHALARLATIQAERAAFDDPFKGEIVAKLEALGATRRPIPTATLSTELYGASMWKLWYHLSALREIGIVRNIGKSGWLLTA